MCKTIREEQMESLGRLLKNKQFNERFAWNEATGRPFGICDKHGEWYISDEDLQQVLDAENRGLTGKVYGTFLLIWKPISQE